MNLLNTHTDSEAVTFPVKSDTADTEYDFPTTHYNKK